MPELKTVNVCFKCETQIVSRPRIYYFYGNRLVRRCDYCPKCQKFRTINQIKKKEIMVKTVWDLREEILAKSKQNREKINNL